MALTFGELFAGIGGISLGLERAGMTPKWHVELDDYATLILEKHWPHVARYRDVRECGKHNLEPVDVIAGGFPCQDVSLAGKRQGLEGERTTLWGEFARIIGELRPRWVVAENVPGLLSSDDGRFFGNVLRDLAALGYDAEWDCIPAAALGAPHIRDRVFIVAYPQGKYRRYIAQDLANGTGRQGRGQPTKSCIDARAMADATGGKSRQQDSQHGRQDSGPGSRDCRGDQEPANAKEMAHPKSVNGKWAVSGRGRGGESKETVGNRGSLFPNADRQSLAVWQWPKGQRAYPPVARTDWWAVEPDVGRVADGVPSRVDRLRCLGNAVVPQVAEYIGRLIVEAS